MSWHKISAEFIKPTLKFTGLVLVPATATAMIWTTMDRLVTILAIILLTTLVLKAWGVNVKIFSRFANTKIGKIVVMLMRSSSMITKINEEYFEEASELIADQGKLIVEQGKKIKEEIKMSKIKDWREKSYLLLKHNKKQILGYLAMALLAADVYFGVSVKYGLPANAANILAGIIFTFVLIVMGGEGFTGNLINKARENSAIAKAEAHKKTKEYKVKLVKVDAEAKLMMKKYGVDNVLPEAMKPDYAKLMQTAKEYQNKIDEILEEIKNNIE